MNRWYIVAIAGLVGGLVALFGERLLMAPPTSVKVDLNALVMEHLNRPELMKESDADRALDASHFADRLDREVVRLARDYNAVVFAAPAVVTGAPDLTAVLRKRLDEAAP